MSGVDSVQTGVTRRGFVKAAAAVGGIGAIAGGMAATSNWLAPANAFAEPDEKVAFTFHQFLCMGNCSLKCTVRDGRLCKVEPNDILEKRYAHCCQRGISEIQHIYSDERIQTPLKRVGERGEGKFEAITWDEAMSTIGEKFKELWDKYGYESIYVARSGETRLAALTTVLSAVTGIAPGNDIGQGNGLDPAFGGSGWSDPSSEMRDWINSKYLFVAGTNLLESSMMQSPAFFEAKEAGCEVFCIDPHFCTTAAKSNRWIPIKPGSDPALWLGMISHILDNKLYDEKFAKANTTLPFLVSEKDGSLLRDHEPKVDADGNAEDCEADPYLVYDLSTKSVVSYWEAKDPALVGSFTHEGQKYRPVFDLLLETQKPYTTAWAAEKTGIDEAVIVEMAEKYAEGPATIALGQGGSDKYTNADIGGHALAILIGLTGGVGAPGRSFGCSLGGGGYGGSLGAWEYPGFMTPSSIDVQFYDFRKKENPIRAIIVAGNTLQQHNTNLALTEEWVKTLDFVVDIEIYNSPSVAYADIVLPACSKFECADEVGDIKIGDNHVTIQEKVLDPLFEAKNDFDIIYEFAKAVDREKYLPASAFENVKYQLENASGDAMEGITLQALLDHQGAMPLNGIEQPRVGFADQVYPTPSKKIHLYAEDQVAYSQALPTWEENLEVFDGSPLMGQYPLQFTQVRSKYTIHSQFWDAKWVQQWLTPNVEMNPSDAEARGLKTGDTVEVFNDRGSFSCRLAENSAVRPGSIRMIEGAWSKFMDGGNMQNVTNDQTLERGYALKMGPVLPVNDTLVEVKKA